MTIQQGDAIPEATLTRMGANGPEPVKTAAFFKGRKVVLFGLPGAFTPTCSNGHLPGFVENAEALRAKGVDAIACLSVNDVFVMAAWGEAKGAGGKVNMLADGNAEFTQALGLGMDASAFGMGQRSKRYAMLVEDGIVARLEIETNPTKADVSGAAHMLEIL